MATALNPELEASRKPPPPVDWTRELNSGFSVRPARGADETDDTKPRVPIIKSAPIVAKERARHILGKARSCFCEHGKELVRLPRGVRIDVAADTQQARAVTLIWPGGDETTEGPIADCYRRVLATERFAVAPWQDFVVTDSLLHMSCGVGEE